MPSAPARDERAQSSVRDHKKPVNVSIRADLVEEARALGLNLSATLEKALESELREHRSAQWRKENATAIRELNEWVEENGIPFEELRPW